MIPTNFEYHAPDSIEAALGLLERYGDECKILSGGHSLIPVLKLRLASPSAIIDIGRINALDYIKTDGDKLRIGALSTHGAIASSALIVDVCPLLAETASQIGDQQVRNRGTIGGSLAHADPAADWPAAVLALDAQIHLRSQRGERTVAAADFFIDMLTSDVRAGEIVTEVSLKLPAVPKAACYLKVPQQASGFAIIGVAVQADLAKGVCNDIRIGVTGLSPTPYRATSTESLLKGQKPDSASIAAAAAKADSEAADAMEDIHASGAYRRHLVRIYTKRALTRIAGL